MTTTKLRTFHSFIIFLVVSCSHKPAMENVKNELKKRHFYGHWRFYGAFGKASAKPISGQSYVSIGHDGTISYTLRGEDREWCNQYPRIDIFSNCKGVEQETGTIIDISDEKIRLDGTFFSPTLKYHLSADGSYLKIQDINLYKD